MIEKEIEKEICRLNEIEIEIEKEKKRKKEREREQSGIEKLLSCINSNL